MEREHEEAMRREFTERVELDRTAYQVSSEAESNEIYAKSCEYDDRWNAGPHAEHWQYLDDAFHDWRDCPDTMERFVQNIAHNRAQGRYAGMTDVHVRSHFQARELTAPDRARAQQRAQRGR